MRQKAMVYAVLVVLLVGVPSAAAQEFLRAPESVEQGAPAAFVIEWSEQSEGFAQNAFFSLDSPAAGRVLSFQCFPVSDTRWACLAGIPSTLPPGDYRVSVVLSSGGESVELQRILEVQARDFVAETIPLNRSLTQLRAEDDPRKAEEAMELRNLVSRFHGDAVYHSGPFTIPVSGGRRTSRFGDRRTYRYVDGASANAVHYGIDIAAPTGTPVRAGGAGRVVMVAERVISGNTVVIEHLPGVYGLHYHLDEAQVTVGEEVEPEDIIGTVGATGLATGPHLHWEVRVSQVPVEPEVLLSAGLIDIEGISENIMHDDATPQ
jgi:murein DD-endopeptidase MepM/ murein hydrolase activator NlpD